MYKPQQIIPMYVVAGFLDSGKTTLIHGMFEDTGFSRGQKTLLVVCEEGEKEYNAVALKGKGVTLHTIEDASQMKPALFADLNRKYRPERVIIEYNSVFTLGRLETMQAPPRWELVQLIALADATTFDNYITNMRQLMADPLQRADLILFNRCEEGMPISQWRRQMKAMNGNATVLFEFTDGHTDDGVSDEDLPYDMNADVIDIPDAHYGTFFLDALDHPGRYDGKMLRLKGQVFADPGTPKGFYRFGRLAMTCCAEDITPLTLLCRGDLAPSAQAWHTLTARAQTVHNKARDRDMVALIQANVASAVKPQAQYVTFT